MKRFRPGYYPKWWRIKQGKSGWIYDLSPLKPFPTVKRDWKHRMFAAIHYLGSHSPITKKWQWVEQKFLDRYRRSTETF